MKALSSDRLVITKQIIAQLTGIVYMKVCMKRYEMIGVKNASANRNIHRVYERNYKDSRNIHSHICAQTDRRSEQPCAYTRGEYAKDILAPFHGGYRGSQKAPESMNRALPLPLARQKEHL